MDQQKILQADHLDIIFDNRNKAYGAYDLRKTYDSRIKKGVGFLMLGVTAVASFSFINATKKTDVVTPRVITTTVIELPPAPPPPKNVTPPPPPPPAPPAKSAIFTPPKIVENDVKPDESMSEISKLHDANPGLRNNDSGIASIIPPGDGDGPRTVVVTPPSKPGIPTFVEQMPQYMGNIQEYLSKNTNYPEAAKEANIQGRVAVSFVVNEDGAITDAKVTRGIGGGCDEEALRVIKAMPKWKPGKQNGIALKVMFTQAITFRLE